MASLSGVYDTDELRQALLEKVYVNTHLTCLDIVLFLTSIPTSLCSLCNDLVKDDSCQPTCCECFETKPTVFNQKCILIPPLSCRRRRKFEHSYSVHLPMSSYSVTVCVCVVHACTSGNTFVFKWPFKCSSCHYNNINNCFYQVIWPERL